MVCAMNRFGQDVVVRGNASDAREAFVFDVCRHAAGGFILYIEYSGDKRDGVTGAGIWPTIEKAKEIAQETASRLLTGAIVTWKNSN